MTTPEHELAALLAAEHAEPAELALALAELTRLLELPEPVA